VTLKTSKGDIRTDSATLGLKVDREASIDAAMEVGRGGFGLFRPFSWAASFLSTREASLIWTVDRSVLDAALPAVEGDKIVPVLEPSLVATGATLSVAPGHPGDALSPDALADRLAGAAGTDDAEVTLEVEQASTDPVHSDEEVQALADQGNQLLQKPLTATFGLDSRAIPAATVASWLRAVPDPAGKLALQVDDGAVDAALHGLYDGLTSQPRDAGFTVQAGAPVLIPGAPGVACCGPAQGAKVLAALQGPGTVAFEPILTPPAFSTEQAQALGIKEEVGQPTHFGPTTQHQCCQPRVTNIHLIADKVRGHVVKPGETFSLNGFVGERKAGDGYVEAPMIENGVDVHAIGGGVSQFATTTMNAAFYAGLDIVEYQSHSLYFTRYPRGREATVSWKKPDLRIKNTTPYGVLIWPEYTETSLTVHLYSTHYVDVVDLPTTDSPQGACTRVTTPRVRTYLDGRVANDSVFAIYRPAEGINC
jgi:vancomycin resistance protein YoaR